MIQTAGAERLNEVERHELAHDGRWGSDGYPVSKVKSGWILPHFPVVYKTKRAAVAQWERYIDILLDKNAGRLDPSTPTPTPTEV